MKTFILLLLIIHLYIFITIYFLCDRISIILHYDNYEKYNVTVKDAENKTDQKYYLKNNENYANAKTKKIVYYDGLPLTIKAEKIIEHFSNLIDCRTRLIECNKDSDCQLICLPVQNNQNNNNTDSSNFYCSPQSGFCSYYNKNVPCYNGGKPITFFSKGRNISGCVCPESFIGQYCEIVNMMRPIYNKTFSLKSSLFD